MRPAGPTRTTGSATGRCRHAAVPLLFALLLAAAPVCAATAAINGDVRYETFGYPEPGAAAPDWENFFEARLRGSGQLAAGVSYEFEGRAVADDVHFTAGAYSLRNDKPQRPYLSLLSGAVSYRPTDALRLTVGKQLVSWSNFDELQPANVMAPHDESDVFRRVAQGVDAVAVHYEQAQLAADLVVVPLAFTPSRLPQGRWQIIRGVEQQQDLPAVRLNETQAGARLGIHLGQLDAALIGYVGRDVMALFVPQLIFVGGDEGFQVRIHDHYAHMRNGGVTATYPLGEDILLRTESVYFNSQDRDRPDFLHSAVGAEYGLQDWRLQLSYLRDDQTISAPDPVTDQGERRFFRSFVFGELRYDPGRRFHGRIGGGYDMTRKFLLLQPEIVYRVWSTLDVALTGDVIAAQPQPYTYFYAIRHEDRIGSRLEYHY